MLSSPGPASPGAGARALEEQLAGLTPLLLGSPPISHEYYDPAEFMEGGPQEADRMDELEYEVSQVARPGQGPQPASGTSPVMAGCSPAQAWLLLSPGGRVLWPLPMHGC